TMSIVPHQAQKSAAQNSKMIVAPIVRPIGDGGVSTISSAAARNASSAPRLPRTRRNGTTPFTPSAGISALADFIKSRLQPMQGCIAAAGLDQRVVGTVLDQAAAFEGDDAIHPPHRRQSMRDDQHRPPFGDLLQVVLNNALALVVEGTR